MGMSGYDVDVTDLHHFQFSSPLLHQEVRLIGIAIDDRSLTSVIKVQQKCSSSVTEFRFL